MRITKLSLRKCQTLQAEGWKETSGHFACSEAQVERRPAAAAWTLDPPPQSSLHTRFKPDTFLFTSASFHHSPPLTRQSGRVCVSRGGSVAETKEGRIGQSRR